METTTKKYFTAAETAKAIRKELKAVFLNIKFSVTSDTYAGGNSVDIRYLNGVNIKKVEAITNKYQYGSFDSMTDMYNINNNIKDLPQVKYVFVNRSFTEEVKQEMYEFIKGEYAGMEGLAYDDYCEARGEYVYTLVRRLLNEKEF